MSYATLTLPTVLFCFLELLYAGHAYRHTVHRAPSNPLQGAVSSFSKQRADDLARERPYHGCLNEAKKC